MIQMICRTVPGSLRIALMNRYRISPYLVVSPALMASIQLVPSCTMTVRGCRMETRSSTFGAMAGEGRRPADVIVEDVRARGDLAVAAARLVVGFVAQPVLGRRNRRRRTSPRWRGRIWTRSHSAHALAEAADAHGIADHEHAQVPAVAVHVEAAGVTSFLREQRADRTERRRGQHRHSRPAQRGQKLPAGDSGWIKRFRHHEKRPIETRLAPAARGLRSRGQRPAAISRRPTTSRPPSICPLTTAHAETARAVRRGR